MKKHKKEPMLYSALAQYASVTFAIQSRRLEPLHAPSYVGTTIIVAAKPHPTAAYIYFWYFPDRSFHHYRPQLQLKTAIRAYHDYAYTTVTTSAYRVAPYRYSPRPVFPLLIEELRYVPLLSARRGE